MGAEISVDYAPGLRARTVWGPAARPVVQLHVRYNVSFDVRLVSYPKCVTYRRWPMALGKLMNCDLAGEGVISTDRNAGAGHLNRTGRHARGSGRGRA
jgi:hypothetical protein